MRAGYGNDNDNDGSGHDEDVHSTDFTTMNFIFLKSGPRTEGKQDPRK